MIELGKFTTILAVRRLKSFELHGTKPTDPLTRGCAPYLDWGKAAPNPFIGSRSTLIIFFPKRTPSKILDPPLRK